MSETPVGIGSNDGRYQLSDTKGTQESEGWTLHEEESVRTGYKDQCLRYNGNLEVDNHVELIVIVEYGFTRLVGESNSELVLEERGVDNDSYQSDTEKLESFFSCQETIMTTYVDAVR